MEIVESTLCEFSSKTTYFSFWPTGLKSYAFDTQRKKEDYIFYIYSLNLENIKAKIAKFCITKMIEPFTFKRQ